MKIISLALGGLLLSGCTYGPRPNVENLTRGLKLETFQLDNGLRIALVEEHSSPTVAVQVWYQVGSRDEEPGKTGLAHLFEHMMFKRTKNLPEGQFDHLLETAGSEGSNAYTVRDATVYVVEVPKESLELALKLEAERMENLVIDDESFNTEREVVQNERRQRYENNPEGTLYQTLYETAFEESSYKWPVIGYQKDLDSMKAQDGQEFFSKFYHPSRALLIVVGDISTNGTRALIQRTFGRIGTGKTIVAREKAPTEPPQTKKKRKVLRLETPVESIMMGIRAPRLDDPIRPAFEILTQVLAGGKSSRLQKGLVDSGISSSVAIESPQESGDSLLLLATSLQPKRRHSEAEKVIAEQLRSLANSPPSSVELQAAKNRLLFTRHMQWLTHDNIAETVGQALSLFGSIQTYQAFVEKIFSVSSDDVQKAAAQFFVETNFTTIVGVPK